MKNVSMEGSQDGVGRTSAQLLSWELQNFIYLQNKYWLEKLKD